MKDLTNQRFGRLVAIRPTEERDHGTVVWLCRCDCGNVVLVSLQRLKAGNTKSCGCLKSERVKKMNIERGAIKKRYGESGDESMIGRRFGRLVVKEFVGRTQDSFMAYRCACDCGNEIVCLKVNLTNGTTRSCGCLRRGAVSSNITIGSSFGELTVVEAVDRRFRPAGNVLWVCECSCGRMAVASSAELRSGRKAKCRKHHGEPATEHFRDLAGQVFGSLLVMRESCKTIDGGIMWRCLCECGKTIDVESGDLISGHTSSCGCKERQKPPMRHVDHTGERFGRLLALEPTGEVRHRSTVWRCLCDCGKSCVVAAHDLKNGNTSSCGCGNAENRAKNMRARSERIHVDGTNLAAIATDKIRPDNKTGVKGVYMIKAGKYKAHITFKGKRHHLGTFETLDEAAEARREAEKELFDPVLEAHGLEPTSEEAHVSKALERKKGAAPSKGDGPTLSGSAQR